MARTNPNNAVSSIQCQDETNVNSNKVIVPVTDQMRISQTLQSEAASLSSHYRLLGNFNTLLRRLSILEVTFNQHVYRSIDELILVQRRPSRTESESTPPSPVKQNLHGICETVTDKASVQHENNATFEADPTIERKDIEFNQSPDISLHSVLDDNRDWPCLTDRCTCTLLRIPLHQRNKGGDYHSQYCPHHANMRKNTARDITKAQVYLKSALRFMLMIASVTILFAIMAYILVILCYLSEQDLLDGRDGISINLPSAVVVIRDNIGHPGSAALASLCVCIGCLFLWIISGNDRLTAKMTTITSSRSN